MNGLWDLTPIYKDFDDPAFAADMQALEENVEAYAAFAATLAQADALAGLQRGIALQEQIILLTNKLSLYAHLRQAANTRDAQAGSQMGRIMAIYSGAAAPQAAFEAWASKLPDLMELIKGDPVLKEYIFLFSNMVDNSRHLLEGRGEEGGERGVQDGGTRAPMADSYQCMAKNHHNIVK